jgi:hypothetical protein
VDEAEVGAEAISGRTDDAASESADSEKDKRPEKQESQSALSAIRDSLIVIGIVLYMLGFVYYNTFLSRFGVAVNFQDFPLYQLFVYTYASFTSVPSYFLSYGIFMSIVAFGVSQLPHVNDWNARRIAKKHGQSRAERYRRSSNLVLRLQPLFYLYVASLTMYSRVASSWPFLGSLRLPLVVLNRGLGESIDSSNCSGV